MDGKSGREKIIEQLLCDGMTYMFGNPGTVEQGFLDALAAYPAMKYILTQQESIAVLAGDGYARATRKPTLVQIHSSPGLGNAIGAMYQAMRGHAPLIIIGGDAGLKYMPMQAQMYGDLVAFAKPVTKWSTMVLDPHSILRTLRRAVKIAATPPMGPVYVCLPADILDMPNNEKVEPAFIPSTRVVPDAAFFTKAADALCKAQKPMIFMGDGIAYSDAQDELTNLAELLGAEVWGVDSGELNMAYDHPLYQGQTGHMFGFASFPITSRGDVNLIAGTYMVPEVFPKLDDIYSPAAYVIHIDLDAEAIAKNHRVDLGAIADPKVSLEKLAEAVKERLNEKQKQAIKTRVREIGRIKSEKEKAALANDEKARDDVPLHASRFMSDLAEALPKDAIIFDEALTCSPELARYIKPNRTGQFFQTRGGSLGVGFPGALGAKLANPKKTVIGFSGDGGSMYTIQALWTAARHKIGAKFVVCNNQNYMLLKLNILQYWKELGIEEHAFPEEFGLKGPVVDFVGLAKSLGVDAMRVAKPDEIAPAIKKMLADDKPFLIDLMLTCAVPGSTCKCGQ